MLKYFSIPVYIMVEEDQHWKLTYAHMHMPDQNCCCTRR